MNDKRTTVSDERVTEAIEVVHRLDAALCNFLNGADDAYTPDLWHEETKRNFARLSEVYNDCHKAELMDLHGSPLLSALLTELQHRREAEVGVPVAFIPQADLDRLARTGLSDCRLYREATGSRFVVPLYLAASPSSPASGVRVKVIDWQQSPPFITSISGDGSYEVNVKVHSMAELHAAHDLVLKAFSDAHSDLLAKRWADANQG